MAEMIIDEVPAAPAEVPKIEEPAEDVVDPNLGFLQGCLLPILPLIAFFPTILCFRLVF